MSMNIYPNQFAQKHTLTLLEYAQVNKYKRIGYTVSLCHHCYGHVPALQVEKDGSVYIIKHCVTHGISVHMIERDADFYHSLNCDKASLNYDPVLLTEATDRCNLNCPHCYHKPDNSIKDELADDIVARTKDAPEFGIKRLQLAGAEASLRPDFTELVKRLLDENKIRKVDTMTNGIRFGDKKFMDKCVDAGLHCINVGLNHPNYIGNAVTRRKQVEGIEYASLIGRIGYVGYTMISLQELHDILEEIVAVRWNAATFRIRAGSEIGINATSKRYYVSDIYKAIIEWAKANHHSVENMPADDNIYHKMVRLNGKPIRIIQWCDITDIDMEELKSGPWNDFVPHDKRTNFLHQIIRRDVWKNQGIMLPDKTPPRYQLEHQSMYKSKLNLLDLRTLNSS